MATNASLLPALSSEVAALTTRAAQLTLAVLGLGRRPVTATVIGQDLAVGVSHVIDADGLRVAALAGSPAVEIYPNFSAFGVNGGYYYARATFAF